jgi:hypothetical protein
MIRVVSGRLPIWMALLLLGGSQSACDDTLFHGKEAAPIEGEGWCGVERLIAADCAGCHSGSAAAGGLDLATDPHRALVGVPARSAPEMNLVQVGDPEASIFYLRLVDRAPSGGVMPPTGGLGTENTNLVAAWIRDGAPGTCTGSDGGDGTEGGDGTDGATASGWCAVRDSIASNCVACHSAAGRAGGLDLATDPHGALVGQAATGTPGEVLVVAGDPAASLAYRKVSGGQASDEGGVMPPSGALTGTSLSAWEVWILDGATEACDEAPDTSLPTTYHPEGWSDPGAHGLAAKLSEQVCVDCHGEDLTGGASAVSCDSCHADGWRTDCTFCHGDPAEGTGAPPRDIDNTTDPADLSFQAHGAHVQGTIHAPFDCVQCHQKPTQVLSLGHLFLGDTTPAQAEMSFSAGLSTSANWNGTSCSNLYCHGYNGLANGTISHTETGLGCADCHPDPTSGRTAWGSRMSGEHEDHLREGLDCAECHESTVNDSLVIINLGLHVNGVADVDLPYGMSRSGGTCTGTCHSVVHDAEDWN